jgi:hypothetical protein
MVTIKYASGTDSRVRVRSFKDQAALERWARANEGNIEILAYEEKR